MKKIEITKNDQNDQKNKKVNVLSLTKKVALVLDSKKAIDVVVLDVRGKSDIADFFVIASGTSTTHIKALPSHVNDEMAKNGIRPLRREGILKETKWSVLDYGFVIIHIFTQELRAEYDIEGLWDFAKKINWEGKSSAEK